MPICIKANKWAANLIIVFQLTVWSVVGIIFLQRGVISLRGEAETRNNAIDTQESFARRNEKVSIEESTVAEVSQQIVEHEAASRRANVTLDNLEDATQNGPRSSMYAYPTTEDGGRRIPVKSSMIRKRTTIGHKQDTRDVRAIQAETIRAVKKNDEGKIRPKENVVASDERSYDTGRTLRFKLFKFRESALMETVSTDEGQLFQQEITDIPSNNSTNSSQNGLVSQHSRTNRVGAAVAIVMLAIGVIMLLLGPLIVILRAIGDRRRTRHMLKSRCENDRPPSYEEAVLMDPVPRYSSLELDTILESSASS
ncbi:uncharacterized protein LOC143184105 [Calliopsis andreniformis]|uniref:uncharacterized protein LOC143184105 n=1 Tax=Calliopsis andreniformis TaxID=337506 RepID=UPI003FCE9F9F